MKSCKIPPICHKLFFAQPLPRSPNSFKVFSQVLKTLFIIFVYCILTYGLMCELECKQIMNSKFQLFLKNYCHAILKIGIEIRMVQFSNNVTQNKYFVFVDIKIKWILFNHKFITGLNKKQVFEMPMPKTGATH